MKDATEPEEIGQEERAEIITALESVKRAKKGSGKMRQAALIDRYIERQL